MKRLIVLLLLGLLALSSCGKRTVNAHGKIIARETDYIRKQGAFIYDDHRALSR